MLKRFPADGVIWAFEDWLFGWQAEQSIASDDHGSNLACADIAVAFVGEADEVSDGIVWACGFPEKQAGGEFLGDFVEDGIEVEPAIIGDEGDERIGRGCLLGGLQQSINGDAVHEHFFAGFFEDGADEQLAVDDAVERDIEAVEEFPAAPVTSGLPAAEEPAEDCETDGNGNLDAVVAQLITDGGEPFVHSF